MKSRLASVAICTLACAACHPHPRDIGREPHLTPIGSGVQVETGAILDLGSEARQQALPRSTWRDSRADLFRDQRAARVGDLVTVKISMNEKASVDSTSNRSRDSSRGLSADLTYALQAFGLDKEGDATMGANLSGATSTEGKGAVRRAENMELMVAAVVTAVMPNGNLVISGSQEIRVNYEVRVLEVAGIVRPRDVSAENIVSYDRIAEARVSYGGRGRIMEVMQPGWGQQIVDVVAPY